jgi:hypothetical protein
VATPEFVDLCKTLYGEVIDAQVIWDDVFKASPDSADVSTHARPKASARTRFERGSNAIGFTAGLMATGNALRDERFAQGGRTSRRLHAAATKIPAPISRLKGKTGAKLAGGALAVQGLNIVGDAAIGATYSDQAKKTKGKLVSVDKSVATEVMGGAHKAKAGLLRIWNPTKNFPKPPLTTGTAAVKVEPSTTALANNAKGARNTAQGKDLGTMLATKSGKVAAGTLGAVGAAKVNTGIKNRRGSVVSVDDGFAKSDDVEFAGEFSKFDDDKRLAFGWASVVSKGGQPVIDKQGDYIAIDDIEKAAYSYVIKSRVGGDNHTRTGQAAFKASDMVESMVFTDDKVAKMGLPDDFPRGWWVGFKVHDENVWSEVRKGNRTGFSIHGKGIRKDQSVDEIMGYTS